MMMRRKDESGGIAVVVAMSAVILFVLASLVVDLGLARDTRRTSQNTADSGALAAANALWPLNSDCGAANPDGTLVAPCYADAIQAAKDYASDTFGVTAAAWASCSDSGHYWYPTGGSQCISFVGSDESAITSQPAKPLKARVWTPTSDVKTTFGTMAGKSKVSIRSQARATYTLGVKQPCGLCVLGQGITHNFQGGDATVNGADIYLNGSSNVNNQGLVASDGNIYIQGTAGGNLAQYDPDPTTGVKAITDPLAGVRLPNASNNWLGATSAGKTNACADGPGIYAGFSVASGSTCTLQPGLYIIASGELKLSGNSSTVLAGNGVSIFFACGSGNVPKDCASTGEKGASLDASGGGSLNIKAPSTDPIKNVALAADRHNIDPANNQPLFRMTGNGLGGLQGAIYAIAATLQMNGNGCTVSNSMVVTNDIAFNGNPSCMVLNFVSDQAPDILPGNLALDQ